MAGIAAPGPKPSRVFLSYSHDSLEHMERVKDLADRLRAYGIDAVVDRYFEDTIAMRWSDWMDEQIEAADFVLVVATPGYAARLKPAGPEARGVGAGVNWEGAIITQSLYDLQGGNTKYFAVYFTDEDRDSIPKYLKGFNYYDVGSPNGFTKLYRRLTNQPEVTIPPLGAVVSPNLLYAKPAELVVSSPAQQAVKDRIEELARVYQELRKSMTPGDERTRRMGLIAARMRALACDAYFMLDYLAKNPEPGCRLAAVSLLEAKPNPAYLDWLSERLAPEKPYVGYRAAQALLVAARVFDGEDRVRTRKAIDDALLRLGGGLESTDRGQTLKAASQQLRDTEAMVQELRITGRPVS